MDIVITDEFKKALDLMESSNKSLFITGDAGSGKSTLLGLFTRSSKKNFAILAPTGVAAVNVGGETIHSFFGFAPNVGSEDIYKFPSSNPKRQLLEKLDCLVIDEISMVRADLLDAVDKSLRLNRGQPDLPFGGVQMLFFGDLLQLPPVLTNDEKESFSFMYPSPYFFDSYAIKDLPIEVIRLGQIFRQTDASFLNILNQLRGGGLSSESMDLLNSRVADEYIDFEKYIYLATINRVADNINQAKLRTLETNLVQFDALVTGEFRTGAAPVPEKLDLKKGARVMLQNNDKEGRWVNGTVGTVEDIIIDAMGNTVVVKTDEGDYFEVSSVSWDLYKYRFDRFENKVVADVVGSFSQIPLKLAYAITIHKSQGKSFDNVLVDLGYGAFAHGQTYVALSRCRSFEGLLLKRPVNKRDIIVDPRVIEWVGSFC